MSYAIHIGDRQLQLQTSYFEVDFYNIPAAKLETKNIIIVFT